MLLSTVFACGNKAAPPDAAAQAPPEPTVEAGDPPPEAEPVPEEAAPASNASFSAKLSYADGSTHEGKVVRVERSDDFYAERGWTDTAMKLTVSLDAGGKGRDAKWEELQTVTVKYGGTSDIDCSYDSGMSPPMYMCVLKTTAKVSTADGASWDAPDRYRWRFTFEDGKQAEFHLYKLPARQQTSNRAEDEDYALYESLQKRVMEQAAKGVKSIDITP